MVRVILWGLALLMGACATPQKDDGEYFNWTSSNEPDPVLDPNALALPAEQLVETTVTASEDVKPAATTIVAEAQPLMPQSVAIPRADIAEPRSVADANVSKLKEKDDDSFLVNQTASTSRPRGLFVSVGSGPQRRYIKADQMYIRTRPDRYSRPLGLIYGGDEVHVTIRGDWAKLDEGRWIRSRWLVKVRPQRFRGGPPEKKGLESKPDSSPEINDQSEKTASRD